MNSLDHVCVLTLLLKLSLILYNKVMGERRKTGFSFPQQPSPALKVRFLPLLEKLRVESCSCVRGEESERKRKTNSFLQHCRGEGLVFISIWPKGKY